MSPGIQKKNTFDPSLFEQLKKIEANHFWFDIRRKWIFDKVKKVIPPPARILEIGCGTGNVSSFLAQNKYSVVGCEYYAEAIDRSWPGFEKIQGSAEDLPFEDNSFDAVGLFDVIEHFENDKTPLTEAIRVVKREGIIAITVPAQEELWSSFDDVSCHKRRYSKDGLNQVLADLNLNILSTDYIFMSLYLPMLYKRRKDRENKDHFAINTMANIFLKKLFNLERLISRAIPLPIGTSLIAIAKKG